MSSIALSNAIGNTSSTAQAGSVAKTTQASTGDVNTDSTKEDTVKLSLAAQIKSMYHQGLNATRIAANLGITVDSVDSYLGIQTATQTIAAAAQAEASTASSSTAATA